jgi:hypothetical protein
MAAKGIMMAAKKPISTRRRRGRPLKGDRPMSSTERAAATRARQRSATDAYWAAKEDVTAVLGHIARLGAALARGDLTQAKKIDRALRKGAGKLAAHWPQLPRA